LLQHPLISLISFLSALILLFRIFNAIAQLLDKLWIWLLKSPIVLFKSLFGFQNKPTETSLLKSQELSATNSLQISQIMEKLETIKQQQQQIIREIATLKQQNIKIK
jgi:hypothetical protein